MGLDDWKGEAKIRAKPKDGRSESARLNNIIYHKARRKAGIPAAGAKKHRDLVASAIRDAKGMEEE